MTKEPWEEEFDAMWSEHDGDHFYKDEWKSFIRRQRQLARIEVLREAVSVVEDEDFPLGMLKVRLSEAEKELK